MITHVDGLRIHAREGGHGPPVVLVHGCGLSSLVFASVVDRLPGRRALAPDLPGFGLSDKPLDGLGFGGLAELLGGWLAAVVPARFVLVAHGLGAAPALAASADRLAGIVLVNAPLGRLPGRRLAALPGLALAVAHAVARGPGEDEHRRALASRGTRRTVERLAAGDGWEAVARRARTVAAGVPTLRVAGTPDPLVPPWSRSAGTVILPRAGHVPPRDAAQGFLACVVPFLDGIGYP